MNECARLADKFPYMDTEELEQRALEITRQYFYFKEKDMLPVYLEADSWREDLV